MDFYLGIDIGTSRVKAVLFDEHFQARASAAESTGPRLSANGHAEQDMARSRELMSELLRRPGFDRRFFSDTGTHLQPCNTSMQLSWLRHYQPERLAQAHYLFFAKDWVRFRLTGVAALDFTDASTSLLNQHSGELSEVVLNEMGLADLQHLFPPRLAPDAPAGMLRDEVAALTGLPAATPVAAGALDVCSAALGCGAVNDGDIYTILGTTCCTGIVCHGRQAVNEGTRYVTHTESGSFINLFPMQAGTPNIDWPRCAGRVFWHQPAHDPRGAAAGGV